MKLILTGATGAAGLEVLRAAIADPTVEHVTALSRRPLPPSIPADPKVEVIVHTDFGAYPPDLAARLARHDACIWALGKSSSGMSEAEYKAMAHDWPLAAAKALREAGAGSAERPFRFVYFSGEGADQEGKAMTMYGRVKGLAEKDLLGYASTSSQAFKAHMLRPAYFFPTHPEDKLLRSNGARCLNSIMSPILNTVFPTATIAINELGKVALEAAKGRAGDEQVLGNKRMKELFSEWMVV